MMIKLIINCYSQTNLTDTYQHSIDRYMSNEAENILFGDISRLSDRHSIDLISLSKLKGNSLKLLRNIIYAKHGHIFDAQDLTEYFSKFNWYIPKRKISDSELNEVEKWNINNILQFEKMNENSATIIWGLEKEGVWQNGYGWASGWGDRFVIYSDNKIEFIYSQMEQLKTIERLVGTYEIKGNVLIFRVIQIEFYDHDQEIKFSGGFGYQWKNVSSNTITFKNPQIIKFPISQIQIKNKINMYDVPDIYLVVIGGFDFYRMEKDVREKY